MQLVIWSANRAPLDTDAPILGHGLSFVHRDRFLKEDAQIAQLAQADGNALRYSSSLAARANVFLEVSVLEARPRARHAPVGTIAHQFITLPWFHVTLVGSVTLVRTTARVAQLDISAHNRIVCFQLPRSALRVHFPQVVLFLAQFALQVLHAPILIATTWLFAKTVPSQNKVRQAALFVLQVTIAPFLRFKHPNRTLGLQA